MLSACCDKFSIRICKTLDGDNRSPELQIETLSSGCGPWADRSYTKTPKVNISKLMNRPMYFFTFDSIK